MSLGTGTVRRLRSRGFYRTGEPMRESIEDKGARYLAEGRVAVFSVLRDVETGRLVAADVRVQGREDEPYRVVFDGWAWVCNCPAYVFRCAHVAAGERITQWSPPVGRPSVRIASPLDPLFT